MNISAIEIEVLIVTSYFY